MPTAMSSRLSGVALLLGLSLCASPSLLAQEVGFAKPNLVLKEVVAGLPKTDKVEISVLTATFKPGDKTPFHTHRYPVTVYVLEGAFTLELEGREPIVLKSGGAMVEPPNVKMTGYNRSTTEETKVVIFYVAEAGTPFLDPAR